MRTQIKPWGNSHGIRLTLQMMQEANLTTDDVPDVRLSDGSILFTKEHRHRTL